MVCLLMGSLTCFKKRFTINWFWLGVTLLCISFFCLLGVWQLQRLDEKKHMVMLHASLAQEAPKALSSASSNLLNYEKVSLKGHFLNTILFLDNQLHEHRFGYDVIQPFELEQGQVVLVDRGWIAGDLTRQSLPVVDIPAGDINLIGSIYYPSTKQWVLGQDYEKKDENTYVIERINLKLLNQLLQKSLYPFIIRLDKDSSHGLVRDWPVVSMPPERHLAYAVQWFFFALVTLILFIALTMKNNNG